MNKKSVIAHPEENDVGGDRELSLDTEMSLEDIRDQLNNQTVTIDIGDAVNFESHAENLAFNEEQVLVCVFPSPDPNAEKIVEVFNNGIPQRFIRGQWQICKRKYVEVLARAKPFNVSTPEVSDNAGGRTTSIQTTTGLRYPFEMRDQNPRGAAWLQGILAEGK